MNKKSISKELSSDSSNSEQNDSKGSRNFKVIPSRYLQSASNASIKMRTNLKPSCQSPRHTISGAKSFMKMHSPLRGSLYRKGKSNMMGSNQTLSESVLNLASKTPQFHSTALYNSDRTQCDEAFSTTIVKPPNRGMPKNLPNISAIVSEPPPSESSKESSDGSLKNESLLYRNITEEDLNKEYLMTLNAIYLNVGAQQTTLSQAKDAKYQMDFLTELIQEETDKNIQLQKMIQLIEHYEKTTQKYQLLKDSLMKLTDVQENVENSLTTLGKALEYHLAKVKVSNIHMAEDQQHYSEQFEEFLQQTLSALQKVNLWNEESRDNVHKLKNLLQNVHKQKKLIRMHQPLLERVSSLSLEEASLRLSLADLQENSVKS